MKKFWTIFSVVVCLTFVMAVPAFGDNAKSGNAGPATELRTDVERGVNNTARALDVDDNMNANQYRTTAADDDMDWSWLGLLGLLGLIGLKGRDRERT
ncbi:WGxxGxxG family protein [Paenibacillus sp. PL91]|uniref:WGxxGxxG family protein n=1 Tax=Paenibacillus sp. PL91 TaxID=2729538 RepID=UPI001CB9D2ED|nr:WGxxGxxG family protein [Paenibacillus sp. PL91]